MIDKFVAVTYLIGFLSLIISTTVVGIYLCIIGVSLKNRAFGAGSILLGILVFLSGVMIIKKGLPEFQRPQEFQQLTHQAQPAPAKTEAQQTPVLNYSPAGMQEFGASLELSDENTECNDFSCVIFNTYTIQKGNQNLLFTILQDNENNESHWALSYLAYVGCKPWEVVHPKSSCSCNLLPYTQDPGAEDLRAIALYLLECGLK